MSVYYNENDPKAAAWLRELIFEGQIAWGDVDERSIEDVRPSELVDYAQCHFFAGIGGWSYALRLAGWPDDRAVWTGSCPCQPFSAAGRGRGFEDPRHLWPTWFRLIRECAPAVVFGEQVASPAGLAWFDLVHADMEGSAYAIAAADLCAAGVGAPHIRQRLYWVAHHHLGRIEHAQRDGPAFQHSEEGSSWLDTGGCRELRLAHADGKRLEEFSVEQARGQRTTAERGGAVGELGDAGSTGSGRDAGTVPRAQESVERGMRGQPDIAQFASPWGTVEWIACRDGKSRPVEPGSFPLAHGIPGRVGLLRGYGNTIVAPLAAAFIEATGLA